MRIRLHTEVSRVAEIAKKVFFEKKYLWIALFLYVWLTTRLIMNHSYVGQDYNQHMDYIRLILSGEKYPFGLPDPPLLYLLGSLFVKIFGWRLGVSFYSIFVVVMNCFGLYILYEILKEYLEEKWRNLFILFIACLPVFVITSVVFAADGLVFFVFILYTCAAMKLFKTNAISEDLIKISLLLAFIQVSGTLLKFTFLSLVPASFLIAIFYLQKNKSLKYKKKFLAFSIIFILPGLISLTSFFILSGPDKLGMKKSDGTMSIRSFVPYTRDSFILTAPSMGDPIVRDGKQINVDIYGKEDPKGPPGFKILIENYYSYPALVHLAIHTDIRNLALGEMEPSRTRTDSNQFYQTVSVILALYLSIAVFIFNIDYMINKSKDVIDIFFEKSDTKKNDSLLFISIWLPSFLWFILIACSLPFVANPVFYWGYWTPRLILPSLVGFSIIVFLFFQHSGKILQTIFSCLVVLQIFIYINILIR
jgi:hypothetical protein